LHNVNGVVLREIIRANFATKHLVMAGAGLSVEYRPVEVGELTVRVLLTAPPADGGLVGRVVPSNPIEHEAGRKALARHADVGGARLKEEIAAGQRRLDQYSRT
jgi:hypothetical protein